jgi:peptidoglycan/LPS O-acetylase OafA/YrhL
MILVFFRHVPSATDNPPYWALARFGWIGVDLFFVLSGYLVGGQIFQCLKVHGQVCWGEFLLRRMLRILSMFYCVLLLYWLVPEWSEGTQLPSMWRFLTFTQNYGLDFEVMSSFVHAWSLCVEEHFYLVLPLLATLLYDKGRQRRMGGLLLLLYLVSPLSRWIAWESLPRDLSLFKVRYFESIYFPTHLRLDGLVAGLTLAWIENFRPRLWAALAKKSGLLLCLGVLTLFLACWLCRNRMSWSACHLGFPLLALGFSALVLALGQASRPSPFWRQLARLTYPVYLLHRLTLELSHRVAWSWDWPPWGFQWHLLALSATLMMAHLLDRLVGRPFLRLAPNYPPAGPISPGAKPAE